MTRALAGGRIVILLAGASCAETVQQSPMSSWDFVDPGAGGDFVAAASNSEGTRLAGLILDGILEEAVGGGTVDVDLAESLPGRKVAVAEGVGLGRMIYQTWHWDGYEGESCYAETWREARSGNVALTAEFNDLGSLVWVSVEVSGLTLDSLEEGAEPEEVPAWRWEPELSSETGFVWNGSMQTGECNAYR